MQKRKEKLSQQKLIEEISKTMKVDERVGEDLGKVLEGLEYKKVLEKVGENDVRAQVFLIEHPEAKSNLEFAKKVFARVSG